MKAIAARICSRPLLANLLVAAALVAALLSTCLAPTESTMGNAQRVMYVHVAVAWMALVGFGGMAGSGLRYLVTRRLQWDCWALSFTEMGWLCASLTLITGSLWAHAAWGTWWTWDPRLLTSFIMWALYSGILILRSGVDDSHQRAKVAAIASLMGLADVPLVVMATRWFRGIHPVSPEMEPSMWFTLVISLLGWTAVLLLLLMSRKNQLQLERRLGDLQLLVGDR